MRRMILVVGLPAALLAASPALGLQVSGTERDAARALKAQERLAPAAPRGGRTIAAFALEERTVTLSAYGRRARARAMGDAEDVQHARAMGKVFRDAPQPALLTLEMRLHF